MNSYPSQFLHFCSTQGDPNLPIPHSILSQVMTGSSTASLKLLTNSKKSEIEYFLTIIVSCIGPSSSTPPPWSVSASKKADIYQYKLQSMCTLISFAFHWNNNWTNCGYKNVAHIIFILSLQSLYMFNHKTYLFTYILQEQKVLKMNNCFLNYLLPIFRYL